MECSPQEPYSIRVGNPHLRKEETTNGVPEGLGAREGQEQRAYQTMNDGTETLGVHGEAVFTKKEIKDMEARPWRVGTGAKAIIVRADPKHA